MDSHAGAQVTNLKSSFLTELQLDSFRGTRIRQEDRVTVRILPIRQNVVFNLRAVSQGDTGIAQLLGTRIHIPRVDGHRHLRGSDCLTVGGLVGEGGTSCLSITNIRNLQRPAATSARDLTKLGIGHWTSSQNIAICV